MEDLPMKKTYITPDTSVENSEGLLLMAQSKGVSGIMDDSLGIDYGGVDEDGSLAPSANGYGSWDSDIWDKL